MIVFAADLLLVYQKKGGKSINIYYYNRELTNVLNQIDLLEEGTFLRLIKHESYNHTFPGPRNILAKIVRFALKPCS